VRFIVHLLVVRAAQNAECCRIADCRPFLSLSFVIFLLAVLAFLIYSLRTRVNIDDILDCFCQRPRGLHLAYLAASPDQDQVFRLAMSTPHDQYLDFWGSEVITVLSHRSSAQLCVIPKRFVLDTGLNWWSVVKVILSGIIHGEIGFITIDGGPQLPFSAAVENERLPSQLVLHPSLDGGDLVPATGPESKSKYRKASLTGSESTYSKSKAATSRSGQVR
jgi:hypothetical protein